MIRVAPPTEPPGFDADCRQQGNAWLTSHPDPKDDPPGRYWAPFLKDLCEGFHNLCGYSALWNVDGTVDHYLSRDNHRHLAYEWSNYRYASGAINSSKKKLDDKVLDPFRVQDDWFEILLPSLQLVPTPRIPPRFRPKAEFTLAKLHLRDGERIIRQRRVYYDLYARGDMNLRLLRRMAPLVAHTVYKDELTAHIRSRGRIRRNDAAVLCQTDADQTVHLLLRLCRLGHLRAVGRGRGVTYDVS